MGGGRGEGARFHVHCSGWDSEGKEGVEEREECRRVGEWAGSGEDEQ